MPNAPHEALHHLFRDDPDLFRRALKECLDEDFPVFRGVAVIDSDLTEIKAVVRDVDAALRIETDDGPELLIIEPQTEPPKPEKIRAWHWYLAYFEAHFGIPASLLIITAKQRTAAGCRLPMELGPRRRASATVHPFVIGPDNTPFITSRARAAEDVMLAVMAALTHRLHPDIAVALDCLAEALTGIDIDSAKFFAEYVEVGLGDGSAHDHWKGIMMTMTYPFASELRRELEARGEVRGRAEGKVEGMADGQSRMLTQVLEARGLELNRSQRALVAACADDATFSTWMRRALVAESADEVFTETA